MLIREAREEDWDYISAISRKSGYNDYINEIGPLYMKDGTVIVAELGGMIVGFAKVEYSPDNTTWLGGLRVHPAYRRMGIAKSLSERLLKVSKSKGASFSRLLIEPSNVKSLNIAEKFGFKKIKSYRFYLGGVDLSDYQEYSEHDDLYVNIGWSFVRGGLAASRSGKFYRKEGNRVFFNKERSSYHVLSLEHPVSITKDGITTVEDGIETNDLLPLHPLEDFPKGILLELDLTQFD